jgi:hypothetical protein
LVESVIIIHIRREEMAEKQTRREVIKKAAYVVPTVLTLAAKPSFACSGSNAPEEKKGKFRQFEEHFKEKHHNKREKHDFGKSFARGKKK